MVHLTSKGKLRIAGITLFVLLPILSFQNCARATFSAGSAQTGLNTDDNNTYGVITQTGQPSCREELTALTVPVKMFFVVDISGSNLSNGSQPGSDPQKSVRGGSMTRFFNTFSTKANFSWGLITFNNSIANTIVANSNASAMSSALTNFIALTDQGNTPYLAALDEVRLRIADDSGRAQGTKYVVVFLSDGLPNPDVDDNTLRSRVQNVAAVVPGQISFNTVYYGQTNAVASERLKMMSQAGSGNFLDTNLNPTGQAFLISDLISLPGVICH